MNGETMHYSGEEVMSGEVDATFEGVNTQFTPPQLVATRRSTVLWKAKRYGRWFMLKSLKPELERDVAHQQQLIKEFNTLMAIQHPGVVSCYGMERVAGAGMCIVMEYVEGETLKQWTAGGHSVRESERIVWQLLDSVAAIHRSGIVHRDLKPENVMVARVGEQVKIIDFGLADTDDYAVFKQPAGTQGYASREQSRGGTPDVRNDVYSLGVIMEQMPAMARRYRRVVKRCLLDIDRRYAGVEQMQAAMRATVKNRKRLRLAAIAVPALAAIAIASVALWPRRGIVPPTIVVNRAETDTIREPVAKAPVEVAPPSPTPAPVGDKANAVEQAKIDGERLLRSKFPSRRLSHWIDTLTAQQYATPDDWAMFQEGHKVVNKYIDEIRGKFTSTELTDIYNHLGIVNGQIIQELYDKINKKPED